jgi:hypothetical protein
MSAARRRRRRPRREDRDRLPIFIVLVIGLSVLLLMVIFRRSGAACLGGLQRPRSARRTAWSWSSSARLGASLLGVDGDVRSSRSSRSSCSRSCSGSMDYNVFLIACARRARWCGAARVGR